MKRFEDYKKAVVAAYDKKKKEGTLPPNLERHTTAKLKRECLDEFDDRYRERDNKTFTFLFGKGSNAKEFYKLIDQSKPDVFRPLNNYLRKNTGSTAEANIELLAWLIDFEPRPYKHLDYWDIGKPEGDLSTTTTEPIIIENTPPKDELAEEVIDPEIIIKAEIINDEADHVDIEEENQGTSLITSDGEQTVEKGILGIAPKFNKTVLTFLATFILIGGLYFYHKIFDLPPTQCMYWNNNHYQPIACDQKVPGATIIAIDTFSVSHFKKITNPSKITENDIGKVYYIKVNGTPQFYTTEGKNPLGNHKQLLPMSKWIYNKYIPH